MFFLKILLSFFPLHNHSFVLSYCNHLNFSNHARFTFISITEFIFINVVSFAGFRLRSVFFAFVFSTKEYWYSFLLWHENNIHVAERQKKKNWNQVWKVRGSQWAHAFYKDNSTSSQESQLSLWQPFLVVRSISFQVFKFQVLLFFYTVYRKETCMKTWNLKLLYFHWCETLNHTMFSKKLGNEEDLQVCSCRCLLRQSDIPDKYLGDIELCQSCNRAF